MKEFEVNIDRGVELDGKHFPLGTRIELDDATATPLVKTGWLVEVAEPGEETVPFVRKDKE